MLGWRQYWIWSWRFEITLNDDADTTSFTISINDDLVWLEARYVGEWTEEDDGTEINDVKDVQGFKTGADFISVIKQKGCFFDEASEQKKAFDEATKGIVKRLK